MKEHILSMLKQAFALMDQVALRQHREPMAFFEELKQKRISRMIWLARLSVMFAVIILLLNAKNISDATWVSQFVGLSAKILVVQTQIFGMLLITTQAWRFWLLYLFSPPMLALLLLCGLADTAPAVFIVGWVIGLPFVLGVLLSDAISLVAYKRILHGRRRRARQRSKGPAADLPALRQWLRVRRIRIVVAFVLIAAAIATPLWQESGQSALWWAMALLFGAAGSVHVDATWLAYFGKWPLVKYDPQRSDMRTTYIGRHALFVPYYSVTEAITPQPEGKKASAALLALLREGGLGPLVHSLCSNLPEEQRHGLLLHLSLRKGGAEAIRFLSHKSGLAHLVREIGLKARNFFSHKPLEQNLPPLCQVATWYADLATEAAKPPDLQQWIALLKQAPDPSEIQTFDHDIRPILARACEALLQYNYAPCITSARQEVADLVEQLYAPLAQETPPPHPLSWLVALRLHLERREQMAPTPNNRERKTNC